MTDEPMIYHGEFRTGTAMFTPRAASPWRISFETKLCMHCQEPVARVRVHQTNLPGFWTWIDGAGTDLCDRDPTPFGLHLATRD